MEFRRFSQLTHPTAAIIIFQHLTWSDRLSTALFHSIPEPWRNHPAFGLRQDQMAGLDRFLAKEEADHSVLPPRRDWFRAMEHTSPTSTRVVILGQDPYHGPGQAHGLCFSVCPGVPFPPSLRNILKEWHEDLGHPLPANGNLERWARSGVLLLNSALTVRQGEAQSHAGKGWETVVQAVLRVVVAQSHPVLFLLWGAPARKLAEPLVKEPHGALFSAHPSPLSAYRGFFGSKPFTRANAWLMDRGQSPLDWTLT